MLFYRGILIPLTSEVSFQRMLKGFVLLPLSVRMTIKCEIVYFCVQMSVEFPLKALSDSVCLIFGVFNVKYIMKNTWNAVFNLKLILILIKSSVRPIDHRNTTCYYRVADKRAKYLIRLSAYSFLRILSISNDVHIFSDVFTSNLTLEFIKIFLEHGSLAKTLYSTIQPLSTTSASFFDNNWEEICSSLEKEPGNCFIF